METWQGGGIPFGYKYNHFLDVLEVNPDENRVLQEIFSMAEKGLGTSYIAEALNDKKLLSRKGGIWDHIRIGYILFPTRLQFYSGFFSDGTKGNWEPLISKVQVNSILKNKPRQAKAPSQRKAKASYLLTDLGIVRCGYCGGTIKSVIANSTHGAKNYYYACALKHRSGSSACPSSALHRQDAVNKLILFDLQETLPRAKDLYSRYVDKTEESIILKLGTYSNKVTKVLKSKKLNVQELTKLLQAQNDLTQKYISLIDNKPSFFFSLKDMEVMKKSVLENFQSIVIYSDRLELNYKYPVNDKFDFSKSLKVDR
ncbi:MAG TPA: recombinase zinc beta ribbon domain-containing protein [Ignavibacteriales bacterium]|nr:recombinase zinc beta ribbon domain-containing protein [Ignavibacteriales bacterium]